MPVLNVYIIDNFSLYYFRKLPFHEAPGYSIVFVQRSEWIWLVVSAFVAFDSDQSTVILATALTACLWL